MHTHSRITVGAAALTLLATVSSSASDGRLPVTLRFAARVGDAPVTCSGRFQNIGTTGSTIAFTEFRLYVSRVRLVADNGTEVPLTLTQGGPWQVDDVALLDFEDGTGTCANGTRETRTVIEGSVPAGTYSGLKFDVGVPFDKNHRDPTLQPSPLNLSRMFWSWNSGYKFARIDLKSTQQPQGWVIHLGSTGCIPDGGPTTAPTTCSHPNRPEVVFATFAPSSDVIVLDIARLLASSNVDTNQQATARGCMSSPDDLDCEGLFRHLGLAFGSAPARPQDTFVVARGAASAAGQ